MSAVGRTKPGGRPILNKNINNPNKGLRYEHRLTNRSRYNTYRVDYNQLNFRSEFDKLRPGIVKETFNEYASKLGRRGYIETISGKPRVNNSRAWFVEFEGRKRK